MKTVEGRLTDEEVEREIERLRKSPLVKLAKKEQNIIYRRRQKLCQLRNLEKRGRELIEAGITADMLEDYINGINEEED